MAKNLKDILGNPDALKAIGKLPAVKEAGGLLPFLKTKIPGETQPSATVVTKTDLSLDPVPAWETPEAPTDATGSMDVADAQIRELDTMLSDLRKANESRLKGEIPGDVADQIRINSAEAALKGGIGLDSPAARALQARDLGLTSLDIQDKGIAAETNFVQLRGDIAKLTEDRFRFQQTLAEDRRKFAEQSRQFGATLSQDALRTQLAERELLLRQDQFNAEQNLRLVGMVTDLVSKQAQLQVSAASAEVDFTAGTAAFDSMIEQIGSLLKKSNPGA